MDGSRSTRYFENTTRQGDKKLKKDWQKSEPCNDSHDCLNLVSVTPLTGLTLMPLIINKFSILSILFSRRNADGLTAKVGVH